MSEEVNIETDTGLKQCWEIKTEPGGNLYIDEHWYSAKPPGDFAFENKQEAETIKEIMIAARKYQKQKAETGVITVKAIKELTDIFFNNLVSVK